MVLATFSKLVTEAQKKIIVDGGSEEYGKDVGVYLAFVVDRKANYSSSLNAWGGEFIVQTFGRQALPMVWDYSESNPFSNSTGCWSNALDWVCSAMMCSRPTKEIDASATQFDAQSDCGLRNIMISTDPPYYDNISYANLSDFFYVWLRQSLKKTYPEVFRTMLVPKSEELVATPYRFEGDIEKAKAFFENGMFHACEQIIATIKNIASS